MPLQPVAVDMTSKEPAEHSQLARLLTDLNGRRKSRADPEAPRIRGLAGQDAARKVVDAASKAGYLTVAPKEGMRGPLVV